MGESDEEYKREREICIMFQIRLLQEILKF